MCPFFLLFYLETMKEKKLLAIEPRSQNSYMYVYVRRLYASDNINSSGLPSTSGSGQWAPMKVRWESKRAQLVDGAAVPGHTLYPMID